MLLTSVLVATSYPLHGDAFRSYLHGFYTVTTIQHTDWNLGLYTLRHELSTARPAAVVVDNTFPCSAAEVVGCVNELHSGVGMIFLDTTPNIFRVLHYLEHGFRAYLYLGDELSNNLRMVVDNVRHGERYLSPSILGLYERYSLYRGVYSKLTPRLYETFKLMGEGLSPLDIQQRLGIDMSVVYRRQYRLRKYFGVDTNEELLEMIREVFEQPV
jgi:DNA-binding NarL/FixJ family response regulator